MNVFFGSFAHSIYGSYFDMSQNRLISEPPIENQWEWLIRGFFSLVIQLVFVLLAISFVSFVKEIKIAIGYNA